MDVSQFLSCLPRVKTKGKSFVRVGQILSGILDAVGGCAGSGVATTQAGPGPRYGVGVRVLGSQGHEGGFMPHHASPLDKGTILELSDRGEFLFALVVSLIIGVVLRLNELPAWLDPVYWVEGEPLMATHDAYAWLAGAKGIGWYTDTWMAQGIAMLHRLTGLPLGVIGFWLPVWCTPLTCVPVCWLAWRLRVPEAGALGGVMAGTSLGLLTRTRIGFCDTDILSLFFPVAVAALVAIWLRGFLRRPWGEEGRSLREHLLWRVVIGLVGSASRGFYPQSGTVILAVFGCAAAVIVVFGRPGDRVPGLLGLVAIFAMVFTGWASIVPAGLALAALGWPQRRAAFGWAAIIALAGAAYFAGFTLVLQSYWNSVLMFAKNSSVDPLASDVLRLPSVTQSIREAQNLDWVGMMYRVAGAPWLFWVSSVGFAVAVWRWPSLVVLVPFWGLGVASVWLGNRFTMYGGVPSGIGLACAVAWGVRRFTSRQGLRWIAQLGLSLFALWPAASLMQQVGPVPVIPKTFAQVYLELRHSTPADARLWQWWDYGYAAQYFAERMSFGDGGLHDGPWLFPLARVHMTSSPRQAAQIMKFVTQTQLEAPNGTYATDPVAGFRALGALGTQHFLERLAQEDLPWPALPEQYLVVTWENMRIAGWISYFGHWDVVSGTSSPAFIQALAGKTDIDTRQGILKNSSRSFPLQTLTFVGAPPSSLTWPNPLGMHAIIHEAANAILLADDRGRSALMVRLLLDDPGSFSPYLELVVDRYPWVRVYRVR